MILDVSEMVQFLPFGAFDSSTAHRKRSMWEIFYLFFCFIIFYHFFCFFYFLPFFCFFLFFTFFYIFYFFLLFYFYQCFLFIFLFISILDISRLTLFTIIQFKPWENFKILHWQPDNRTTHYPLNKNCWPKSIEFTSLTTKSKLY